MNEFAIGMGPTIFKYQGKETKYALRLFPIGGFCAMEGEDEESNSEGAFCNKAVWKRIIIVSAGAIMNIILGVVLMAILLCQQSAFPSMTIAKFADNAVSSQRGLRVGDKILSIDGYRIYTDKDFSFALATAKDSTLDMVVLRDGNKINLNDVKFATIKSSNNSNEVIQLDFRLAPIEKTFFSTLKLSFTSTFSTVRMVWATLIGLISGKFGFNEIAGPVGTVSVISQVASAGLKVSFVDALNNIIMVMMLITVNLGVFNLLPLPALDGGRLMFLVVEAIRGKPVNPKYEGFVHAAGLALLMVLMVLVTFNDVFRLFSGKGIGG